MIKEFIVTVCMILFSGACVYFLATIPREPLKYRKVKVTIDSVSVGNTYDFLPDKTWTYYTKYGMFTSRNEQIHKVGDTIEIKLVKTK